MKTSGVYLDDVSHVPVDKMPPVEREATLKAEAVDFTRRVAEMQPDVVVVALRKIDQLVRKAVEDAGSKAQVFSLPFPGNGHQSKYMAQLAPIVSEYL